MAARAKPAKTPATGDDMVQATEREPLTVRVSAELVAEMPALSRTDMSLLVSVGVPEDAGEGALALVPLVEWQLVETTGDLDDDEHDDVSVSRIVSYENVGFLLREMCDDFARVTDHLARMSSSEMAPPGALVTSVTAYLDEALASLSTCRDTLVGIGGGPATRT